MMNQFYSRYQDYNQEELFEIIIKPDEFQSEAVEAAQKIISEKNWTTDLNKQLEIISKKKAEDQKIYDQEIKEKAEYYKNVVAFKNDGNSFQVRIADIPKFEAALFEKGIEFYREDKNIGVQLDSYPTQTYFFKNKDTEAVDEITKNLALITVPYADIKPFIGFEIKVLLIVIVLSVLIAILK